MKLKHLLIVILLAILTHSWGLPKAPVAVVRPDTVSVSGRTMVDNWSYLRNRDDKRVHKLLKAENKYAKSMMKPSRCLADSLYHEFLQTLGDNERSYPWFEKGYYYYTQEQKGKAYPLHYRSTHADLSQAQLIMDENQLARGHDFFALGVYAISPDQRYLAYSLDLNGDEVYKLYLKDLRNYQTIDLQITNITDLAWCNDNYHFLYTTMNDRWQTDNCYLGDISGQPGILKYHENDAAYDLSFYKSCDKSKLFLLSYSKNQTEIRFMDASLPEQDFVLFRPRAEGVIYYPDYLDGTFYIQTNLENPDQSIMTCSEKSFEGQNWQPLISGQDGEPIDSFQLFSDQIVLLRRSKGFKCFRMHSRKTGALLANYTPERPSDLTFWHNPDPGAKSYTFTCENETTPLTIFSYDLSSQKASVLYQYPRYGSQSPEDYTTELRYVSTKDGRQVPLCLVFAKNLDLTRPHPLWLYGYGAYGDCEEPYFSESRYSLLKRGFIYAVAHVRGGGEMGNQWYREGKLLNKQNSFSDFIACMDYVLAQGLCTSRQMVIEGGSAGGLLMGAVANKAYAKCRLVIADVPFVDVVNTMLDDSLPLTLQEYEEWGNPHDPMYLDYMLQYSPYDNVQAHSYPAFLVSTAWNDTRVGYWEALKWVQKLRAFTTSPHPVLYRINWHEGHTGSNDRYQSLRYFADEQAYAIQLLRSLTP